MQAFSKLLLLCVAFSFVLQSMEIDQQLNVLDPSIPDTKGICWLAFLPAELQDEIAFFLEFKNESEKHFEDRLKKYCEEVHKGNRRAGIIDLGDAKFFIENGEVKKAWGLVRRYYGGMGSMLMNALEYVHEESIYPSPIPKSQNVLTKLISSFCSTAAPSRPSEFITHIGLSVNGNYLIALARETHLINSKMLALYLLNLRTKTNTKIELPKIIHPEEATVSSLPDLLSYINRGYSYTACGNSEQPHYAVTNLISLVAVSCDGKKIALANNSTVYLMEQDKKNNWECKTINQEEFRKVDTLQMNGNWPDFWHWQPKACIDFNREGTHLGIGSNSKTTIADKITIQEIGKKSYRRLCDYFKNNLICKNLLASSVVILEK